MEQTGPPTTGPGPDDEPGDDRAAVSVSVPPPPPPVLARPRVGPIDPWARPAEAGQLSPGWRVVTAVVWGLVFVCLIAVWKTSRELGINTWWLGPIGEPAAWPVSMLPFLAPITMILLSINNAKWIPWFGLGAAAACAIVGLLDVGRAPGLAVVELVVAGAGALAAVAGLSGRYQRAPRA